MKKLKIIEKKIIPVNLNCIVAQWNPKPNESSYFALPPGGANKKIYTPDFPKRQLPKSIFQSSNFLNV